jgi:hypothetical protein
MNYLLLIQSHAESKYVTKPHYLLNSKYNEFAWGVTGPLVSKKSKSQTLLGATIIDNNNLVYQIPI